MKKCPYCAESIMDDAIKCRYCGEFLSGARAGAGGMPQVIGARTLRIGWGFEYKSKLALFGLPLIHVATGVDASTGKPRVARGVIAFGNIAMGLIAFGGISLGGFTFGGISVGVIAIGGMAVGGLAFGGMALGALLAVGGMAVSLAFAVGGGAIAPCAFGGSGGDMSCFKPVLEALMRWGMNVR